MTGACGCIRHGDGTWTLCAECQARIGIYGTCLGCGGAADELWTADGGETDGCSKACALIEAEAAAA